MNIWIAQPRYKGKKITIYKDNYEYYLFNAELQDVLHKEFHFSQSSLSNFITNEGEEKIDYLNLKGVSLVTLNRLLKDYIGCKSKPRCLLITINGFKKYYETNPVITDFYLFITDFMEKEDQKNSIAKEEKKIEINNEIFNNIKKNLKDFILEEFLESLEKIYTAIIRQHIKEKFTNIDSLHEQLQKAFIAISKSYSFQGDMEINGKKVGAGEINNKRFDVVITNLKKENIIAIEIDAKPNYVNFRKLYLCNCKYKIWFCFSHIRVDYNKIKKYENYEDVIIIESDSKYMKILELCTEKCSLN